MRLSRLTLLTALATSNVPHVGCTVFNGTNPCEPEVGEIPGWVFYSDGHFIDADNRPYAVAGDRPFVDCSIIRGRIALNGDVSDLSDFDEIESIDGFYDNGSNLERAPIDGSFCGVLSGFPALTRIEGKVWDTGSTVDNPTICYYLDGFDKLAFAGRDFNCRGSPNLGTELTEVKGRLTCPEERLEKLERVGEYNLTNGRLPNLKWAGRLSAFPVEMIDLPLLEHVGPYQRPNEGEDRELSALIIAQPSIRTISLPMLRLVDARLEVEALGRLHPDIYVEGHAEEIRSQFEDVTVTGRRIICENDPTDPCPGDEDCEEVYGENSLECCGAEWPTCLETRG